MSEDRVLLSSSNTTFDSLSSVVDSGAVRTGDTITLQQDELIENPLVITKTCTIDLGGHEIFVTIPGGILIKGGVEVTFTNGGIQSLADGILDDIIIVQGVRSTLIVGTDCEVNTSGTAILARRKGNVVVNGGDVTAIGEHPTLCVDGVDSTLTMNIGSIVSLNSKAISISSGGLATIKDGEVYTKVDGVVPGETHPAVAVVGQESAFILDGGSVFSPHTVAISAKEGAAVEVNNGNVFTQNPDFTTIELENDDTSFKMTGGWVYSTQNSVILSSKTHAGDVQHINITAGKIGAEGEMFLLLGGGDHGIAIGAGTYVKGRFSPEYLPEGYVVSRAKDEYGYAEIILKDEEQDTGEVDTETEFTHDYLSQSPLFTSPLPEVIYDEIPATLGDVEGLPDRPAAILPESQKEWPPELEHEILPDDVEVEPENNKTTFNCSINVKQKLYIYRTPGRNMLMTEWRGALYIHEGGYFSPTGEEFVVVKFRIPGSGKSATGYAALADVQPLCNREG